MFTGIVEELGRVAAIQALPDNAIRITIEGPTVLSDANLGDSICVNGVCLTVAEQNGDQFTADVMSETINRTTIGDLLAGSQVNLERCHSPWWTFSSRSRGCSWHSFRT
jgi:riboflavin synthase